MLLIIFYCRNAQISELKKRVSELTEQRIQLAEQSTEISEQLDRKKKQKKALKIDKKDLTSKIAAIQSDLERSIEREEESQKTIKSLSISLQNKDNDNRLITVELQQELSSKEETIGKYKKKIQELEKENVLVHELRERVEILVDAQAEAEQDKKRLQRLREKMDEFKEFKNRFVTMEQKYESLMKQNSENNFQLQQQKQTIQNLTSYKEQVKIKRILMVLKFKSNY